MDADGLFHLHFVCLKFLLQLGMLAYLFLQACENVLICWQFLDRHGNFCEKGMSGKYPFIWPNFFFDGIVLCPYLDNLFLLLFLQSCQSHLKQIILFLILICLLAKLIHFRLLLLQKTLCSFLSSLRLFDLSIMFEFNLFELAVEIADLPFLLHELDLVLNMMAKVRIIWSRPTPRRSWWLLF